MRGKGSTIVAIAISLFLVLAVLSPVCHSESEWEETKGAPPVISNFTEIGPLLVGDHNNQWVTITYDVDDTAQEGSNILSADISIDGGPWLPISAVVQGPYPVWGYTYQYNGSSTLGYQPEIVPGCTVNVTYWNNSANAWTTITTISNPLGQYSVDLLNYTNQTYVFINVSNNPVWGNLGYNWTEVDELGFPNGRRQNVTCGVPYDIVINQPIPGANIPTGSSFDLEYTIVDRDGILCPGFFTYGSTGFDPLYWEKQGIVINTDTPFDDYFARDAWVIKDGATYKMWYGGYDGSTFRILYATSVDGINWTKHGIVLNVGGANESADVWTPCVLKEDGLYKMWYGGSNVSNYRIFYANSTDGINWTKQGLALDLGGTNEDVHVMGPSVLKDDDGLYKMWYGGFGSNWRIFYANSIDGLNWNKQGFVLDYGDTYEEEGVKDPFVLKINGEYQLWYSGIDNNTTNRYRIFYAASTNGVNWDKKGLALDYGHIPGEDEGVSEPCVIKDNDGLYKMWYTGRDWAPADIRILYATSPFTECSPINISACPTPGAPHSYEASPDQTFDGTDSPDLGHFLGSMTIYSPESQWYINISEGGVSDTNPYLTPWGSWWLDPITMTMPGWLKDWDNITINVMTATTFEIYLHLGWNLISLPLIQSNVSINAVLSSISGKWDYIQAYDATDPDHWKTYSIYKPEQLNDLLSLDHTMGFWINITEPNVTLTVSGPIPTSTSINLYAGWNLVGYPSLVNETVANALWGTGADKVEVFDPGEPYRIREVGPTYVMKPGEGYWVHVPADTVWTVDW